MNKILMFIGQFFAGSYKAISEASEDTAMKAFEADAEVVMQEMEAKDARIAALEGKIADVNAQLSTAQQSLADAQAQIAGLETELAVFGANAQERAAYASEHANLLQMYADDERTKAGTGADLNGPEPSTAGESLQERKERIAQLKAAFPNTFK